MGGGLPMSFQDFMQLFLYAANWNLQLNLLFIGLAVVYLLITGPYRHKFPGKDPVSVSQKLYFMFAIFIANLAISSPLDLLAHELFSMHMLQMSLLFIVLPPFLWLGIPDWMIRPVIELKGIRPVFRFLTGPIVILFLFNGAISLYHVPIIFDAIMESHFLHYVSHTILLILALCMWWPVVCPVPEWDKTKPLLKLVFIFANGFLLTPACALIMFGDHVLFETYRQMSQLAPILTPLNDQQLGGVIMKIVQELVYISAIGIVFKRWMREQKKEDERDLAELMSRKPVTEE